MLARLGRSLEDVGIVFIRRFPPDVVVRLPLFPSCLLDSVVCNSAVRAPQSERDREANRKRAAGVRIGTADECNICNEHIDLGERVR